jgi:hypothetical protein
MTKRRSWPGARALAASGALCFSLATGACKREAPSPPRPSASSPQPSADPRRFEAALAGLPDRWKGAESSLPDCAPLLAKEAARARCTLTHAAVTALQTALARNAPSSELAPLAANAALSAQRAAQALRESGVARLFQERAVGPRPSASAAPPPAVTGHAGHAHPSVSALPSALVRAQGSKDLDAINAYARVATLGLRQLAIYLEFGPLELRQGALRELERLAREEPHWAGLRALVNEALLVEADAELKRELTRLREQLG